VNLVKETCICAFWFKLKSRSPVDETSMVETQRFRTKPSRKKAELFNNFKEFFYSSKFGIIKFSGIKIYFYIPCTLEQIYLERFHTFSIEPTNKNKIETCLDRNAKVAHISIKNCFVSFQKSFLAS
jgi:hypothetical protein